MKGQNPYSPMLPGLAALVLFVFSAGSIADEPFRPTSDDQVLEEVPASSGESQSRVAALRAMAERNPDQLGPAVTLAREYLKQYRKQGDARYLGYAEAAIDDWLSDEPLPDDILLIRAHLSQSRHDFESALDDLAQLLERDSRQPQALLMQASIATVRADYPLARESCENLARMTRQLVVTTCLSAVTSITEGPDVAYQALQPALDAHSRHSAATRAWALTLAGEIAARQGRIDTAEAHFEEALTLTSPNIYRLNAYADLLLHQDRPEAALRLLEGRPAADGILLRQALAAAKLGRDDARELEARLDRRFEAARARGDNVHRREATRFLLELRDAPNEALEIARANWDVQREPTDARLLMRAALTAGQPEAARPALDWMGERFISVRLQSLAERLREAEQ